jgi:vacuolar-type H+-ATPase subunit I/STV1
MNVEMCPLEIVGLKSNLADTIQVLRDLGYVHIDELTETPEISARPLTLDRETLHLQEELSFWSPVSKAY